MDHPAIDDQEVIERYLRGRLSADDARAFELHYLSCPACLDQLEQAEEFAAAIKRTAARGLVPSEPPAAAPEKSWRFAGFAAPPYRWLALAALLLLVIASQERRQSRLIEEKGGLIRANARATTELAQAAKGRAILEEQVAEAQARTTQPRITANLLPVFLGVLRGAEDAPSIEVAPAADVETVLLIVEPAPPEAPEYAAILSRGGEVVWKGENLRANDLGVAVAVPRALLLPGTYRLEVSASAGGRTRSVGRGDFQVP